MSARGVERVLAKCQACIDAGSFYEAHQMYRTLYFRYNAQHKYTEAIDLLYTGASTLLKNNQHTSGADLAMLLIDVLNKSEASVTSQNIDKIIDLFKIMDPECPERYNFLTAAVHWSKKVDGKFKRGHPELHKKFGIMFWEERNFVQARYHYLHSCDGKGCATMLIEYHTIKGYASEVDLFIAQAVLQYLCLQNKDTANEVFSTFTANHPQIEKGPPYVMPLLNFLSFLLLALEGGKLAVFSILCEKYETSLNRDPSYKEYLDKIGQLFFGLPPPQASSQGIFGNLLQSLMTPSGDDSDEDSLENSVYSEKTLELD
ncbi:hypothetical protein LOTGIDRAFT_154705 [Lottia gigantea]|uniref:Golgi to ER traffic protein 4 homolog n=1 Tax=Lottia gigantea TaxID=225164 RepID=V4A1N0_LOTGI|nr:hypothetical protein LOTGIDRAFT_154705 [Lottia gigantea]ESO87201.1 hypothetical protein LOTGIDRAFT_154705 [Lottia gigantea]